MAKRTQAKLTKRKIALGDWTINTIETAAADFKRKMLEAVAEVVEIAIEEKAYCYFPFEYNRKFSPVVLAIKVPISNEDEEPEWHVNIAECVDDMISSHIGSDGCIEQTSRAAAGMTVLRDGLQECVDKLTAVLNCKPAVDKA